MVAKSFERIGRSDGVQLMEGPKGCPTPTNSVLDQPSLAVLPSWEEYVAGIEGLATMVKEKS